jgi:hypothetical protein
MAPRSSEALSLRFRSRASLELELVALRHQLTCGGNPLAASGFIPATVSCGCASTECGRGSSTPWYWVNRRRWSNGIARAFGSIGGGDHAEKRLPGPPPLAGKVLSALVSILLLRFRSRAWLELELVALRHDGIAVIWNYQSRGRRRGGRPRIAVRPQSDFRRVAVGLTISGLGRALSGIVLQHLLQRRWPGRQVRERGIWRMRVVS